MWTPRARPELLRLAGSALGMDAELFGALAERATLEPFLMTAAVACCGLSIVAVAASCALALHACGLGSPLAALGALFAAACTFNLMRLVHASAGLGSGLDEELLSALLRPSHVPVAMLMMAALALSQGACAGILMPGHVPNVGALWCGHAWAASAITTLTVLAISAPALLRVFFPEAARSYEHLQRLKIERRVADQRDTCAELCDSLLAYELDRLASVSGSSED